MATVQHIEKFLKIKELIASSNSLEAEVSKERLNAVIARSEKIIRQREFLREERRRLRLADEFIQNRKKCIDTMNRDDWPPAGCKNFPLQKHLSFNVGGFLFEISEDILNRDPSSLFAELCKDNPPVAPSPQGIFYFDRNWWVFRYMLMFLRDGTLPEDRGILSQMYKESNFWKLTQLRIAIEEEKLHLRDPPKDDKAWWRTLPNYFQAIIPPPPPPPPPAPTDWWKDAEYKGKLFGPISSDPEKGTTKTGEKDEKLGTITTWGLPPAKKEEEKGPQSLFFH